MQVTQRGSLSQASQSRSCSELRMLCDLSAALQKEIRTWKWYKCRVVESSVFIDEVQHKHPDLFSDLSTEPQKNTDPVEALTWHHNMAHVTVLSECGHNILAFCHDLSASTTRQTSLNRDCSQLLIKFEVQQTYFIENLFLHYLGFYEIIFRRDSISVRKMLWRRHEWAFELQRCVFRPFKPRNLKDWDLEGWSSRGFSCPKSSKCLWSKSCPIHKV